MYLKKLIKDNRGVSLPLVIGLFLLLVILTTTVNQLVINALQASRQIEFSDKAYYAAESGIEDALYELSAYGPGYETVQEIGENNSRRSILEPGNEWEGEWDIRSEGVNQCDDFETWSGGFSPNYCGTITNQKKLVVHLSTDITVGTPPENNINWLASNNGLIDVTSLQMRFRVPPDLVASQSLTSLAIDNDGDFSTAGPTGLNEDPEGNSTACAYSGTIGIDDDDCDGRINEDNENDPVLLWKLVDNRGSTFQPLRGCMTDPEDSSHPGFSNSNLCEKDFTLSAGELFVEFDENDYGINQQGDIQTLDYFIHFNQNGNPRPTSDEIQLEVLIVSPMETIDLGSVSPRPIPITHFDYGIQFTTADLHSYLPAPYHEIRSDGYFRGFKQSISTNIDIETSSELLDLTIIQQ